MSAEATQRRALSRLARDRGWALARTKSNHFRLTHPSGAIVIASSTPSDSGCLKRIQADMRRAERSIA